MNNINNDEVMAAISAAIAAFSADDSSCKLVVRSIRRVGQMTPIWNMAGRSDSISNKLY